MTFWQPEDPTHPAPETRTPEPINPYGSVRVELLPDSGVPLAPDPPARPRRKALLVPGSHAPGRLGRLLLHLVGIVWIDDDFCLARGDRGWQIYYCGREFWSWRGFGPTYYATENAARSWLRICRQVLSGGIWGDLLIPDDLRYPVTRR